MHPAMIIVPVQALTAMLGAQSDNDTKIAKHTLNAQIRSLELQAEREKNNANKEVILAFVDAARHVFDRKLDFLTLAYNRMVDLIEQRQASLIDEERRLTSALFASAGPPDNALALNSRLSDITKELNDLRKSAFLLNRDFVDAVSSLELSITLRQIRTGIEP